MSFTKQSDMLLVGQSHIVPVNAELTLPYAIRSVKLTYNGYGEKKVSLEMITLEFRDATGKCVVLRSHNQETER